MKYFLINYILLYVSSLGIKNKGKSYNKARKSLGLATYFLLRSVINKLCLRH